MQAESVQSKAEPAIGPEAQRSSAWRRELARWGLALALVLPILLPYISHYRYAVARGLMPTGFLIRDMPYYMANARAHFADGHFHPFYALPFSPHDDSPRIYFQPHTLLLALMWKASGLEIHTVFLIFSALAAMTGARVALALYEHLVGFSTRGRKIALPLFFWGGGFIVLGGLIKMAIAGASDKGMVARLFDLDPFGGWWFLYFGRNLLFGTEAYYHALFFGSILLAIQKRYVGAALCAFVLSISHPFTGVELLLVLSAWVTLEWVVLRSRAVPFAFAIATGAILAMHVGYYLWFLPHASPEHQSLTEAWSAAFNLSWQSLLAAHLLVFVLALWTVRTRARWRAYFAQPSSRLLAIWFLVALALSNHDLVMNPVQPLHFTRGYIWTPLFFIGAPSLVALLDYLLKKRPGGAAVVASLCGLFLFDNMLWLTTVQYSPDVIEDGMMLPPDRWEILTELRKPEYNGALVLSRDVDLGYLVTAYTPLRAWYSHWANTPFADERKEEIRGLFNDGVYLDQWRDRKVVVILRRDITPQTPAWLEHLHGRLTKENASFQVYEVDPTPRT